MTIRKKNRPANEPHGSLARLTVMKHAALIIHLVALTVLFSTLAQPYAIEKPAGVRRAIETVSKKDRSKASIGFQVAITVRPVHEG